MSAPAYVKARQCSPILLAFNNSDRRFAHAHPWTAKHHSLARRPCHLCGKSFARLPPPLVRKSHSGLSRFQAADIQNREDISSFGELSAGLTPSIPLGGPEFYILDQDTRATLAHRLEPRKPRDLALEVALLYGVFRSMAIRHPPASLSPLLKVDGPIHQTLTKPFQRDILPRRSLLVCLLYLCMHVFADGSDKMAMNTNRLQVLHQLIHKLRFQDTSQLIALSWAMIAGLNMFFDMKHAWMWQVTRVLRVMSKCNIQVQNQFETDLKTLLFCGDSSEIASRTARKEDVLAGILSDSNFLAWEARLTLAVSG